MVNLDGEAVIEGAEGGLKLSLPFNLSVRATVSYAWGEGPNPGDRPEDQSIPFDDRVPLSRIPPLNGTAELLWRHHSGFYAGGGLRWAKRQNRLALSDLSDARIPRGGTPGFTVLDLRAGYRAEPNVLASIVLENVTDEAYRYHGSSVNGAGFGVITNLELEY